MAKRIKIFSSFLLTLFAVNLGLTNIVNASTISDAANKNVVVPFSGYTMKGSPGNTINTWHFMYYAGPYALYRNSVTGAWRHVQIVGTAEYTIYVIFDGILRRVAVSDPQPKP